MKKDCNVSQFIILHYASGIFNEQPFIIMPMSETLYSDNLRYKHRHVKNGIWLYFLLLIFEGALRKWALPGLASPLLIIRDPLVIWLVLTSVNHGLLTKNIYIFLIVLAGVLSLFTAIFIGHGNITVAVFGARVLLVHFPFLFVVGRILNRTDVINIGKACLWISIPMTVLIVMQFYSPQSAWVNRGIGGDLKGAGFSGALGYFRPSGTFSFTNGNSLFYGLLAPFVFYFWLNPNHIQKWILIAATISLMVAIPISISRSLFFSVLVSMIFLLIAAMHKPRHLGPVLYAGIAVVGALSVVGNTTFFTTATQAFASRFETANDAEGGAKGVLVDRYLGGMVGALTNTTSELPFFGYGLGMGTNAGSMMLTGNRTFLISEGEWGRLIGEMGALFGLLVIFVRLSLSVKLAILSYKKMIKGDLLPWLLLSFGLLQIPQGQWAQPTSLGFGVLIGGLIIGSFRTTAIKD